MSAERPDMQWNSRCEGNDSAWHTAPPPPPSARQLPYRPWPCEHHFFAPHRSVYVNDRHALAVSPPPTWQRPVDLPPPPCRGPQDDWCALTTKTWTYAMIDHRASVVASVFFCCRPAIASEAQSNKRRGGSPHYTMLLVVIRPHGDMRLAPCHARHVRQRVQLDDIPRTDNCEPLRQGPARPNAAVPRQQTGRGPPCTWARRNERYGS